MKLSKTTLQLLNSFSTINKSLYFVKGSKLRTLDVPHDPEVQSTPTMMGTAYIEEEFPMDFPIFDVSQLLGVIKLFDEPDLEFHEKYMIIKSGATKVRYLYSSDVIVKKPPMSDLKPPSVLMNFKIDSATLKQLLNGHSVMNLNYMTIASKDGYIYASVRDVHRAELSIGENTNELSIQICEYDGPDFHANFHMQFVSRVLLSDYDVEFGFMTPSAARITFKNEHVEYLIMSDTKSKYTGEI